MLTCGQQCPQQGQRSMEESGLSYLFLSGLPLHLISGKYSNCWKLATKLHCHTQQVTLAVFYLSLYFSFLFYYCSENTEADPKESVVIWQSRQLVQNTNLQIPSVQIASSPLQRSFLLMLLNTDLHTDRCHGNA